MASDKADVVFYCVPDDLGAQAHFWDGKSGLLCRPPKGTVSVERVRCARHREEADRKAARLAPKSK
jgi:hypothetical protein